MVSVSIKKIFSGFIFAVFAATNIAIFLPAVLTEAQEPPFSAEFRDRSNIVVTGTDGVIGVLNDRQWDNDWNFVGTFPNSERCQSVIDGFDNDPGLVGFGADWGSAEKATVNLRVERWTGTGCDVEYDDEITIGVRDNARLVYSWVSSDTIQRIDDADNWTFVLLDPQPDGATGGDRWFTRTNEDGATTCIDTIVVNAAGTQVTQYEMTLNDDTGVRSAIDNNCYLYTTLDDLDGPYPSFDDAGRRVASSHVPSGVTTTLLNQDAAGLPATEGVNIGLAGVDDNPNCESTGVNLSWLLCPIVNGALDTADWVFNKFIGPYLFISPLTTADDDIAYTIWQSFRTIGNILLVFGLLFIVFGQSIGGGLVDAYTAKKAMPRILIAAIFINLSFFVSALLVDIFNVLGTGIGQLITAPLDGAGSFNFSIGQSFASGVTFAGGGLLATVLGGGFLVALLQGGLGQFALIFMTAVGLPMLILCITIFGTLVIRRGLIILLAVISPVAAALFILPNTEKYARQWFSLFTKALIVYPIIVAIFAIADVLSVMILNSGADDALFGDVLTQLVGMVVLFMPLFLIPFSFKLAGGALATVAGAVSGFGNKRREKFMGNELDQESRKYKSKQRLKGSLRSGAMKRGQWIDGKSSETGGFTSKRINAWNSKKTNKINPKDTTESWKTEINKRGGSGRKKYGPAMPDAPNPNDPSINVDGGVGNKQYGPWSPPSTPAVSTNSAADGPGPRPGPSAGLPPPPPGATPVARPVPSAAPAPSAGGGSPKPAWSPPPIPGSGGDSAGAPAGSPASAGGGPAATTGRTLKQRNDDLLKSDSDKSGEPKQTDRLGNVVDKLDKTERKLGSSAGSVASTASQFSDTSSNTRTEPSSSGGSATTQSPASQSNPVASTQQPRYTPPVEPSSTPTSSPPPTIINPDDSN